MKCTVRMSNLGECTCLCISQFRFMSASGSILSNKHSSLMVRGNSSPLEVNELWVMSYECVRVFSYITSVGDQSLLKPWLWQWLSASPWCSGHKQELLQEQTDTNTKCHRKSFLPVASKLPNSFTSARERHSRGREVFSISALVCIKSSYIFPSSLDYYLSGLL